MERKGKYKIIVLGDAGVGKTSLIRRFVSARFMADYKLTIGVDMMTKDLEVDGQFIASLSLWDIAGQSRFAFVRKSFYLGVSGVILLFDVTRKDTLLNIKNWLNDLLQEAGNASVILAGNKIDLKEKRQISPEEAAEMAKELGIPYFETSALTGENVNEIFKKLVIDIRNKTITKLSTEEFKEWRRKDGVYELDEIPTIKNTAESYIKNGNYFEAAETYRRIADTYRLEIKGKDQPEIKEMTANALKYYELSADMYLKAGKFTEAAWSFEHLRSLLEGLEKFKESLDAYIKSAENYEKAGNEAGAAWRYSAIANIYEANFNFNKAQEYYEKSWNTFLKAKEFSLILEPIQKLSLFYEKQNNYGKIKEIWNKAIDAAIKYENFFWAGQISEVYIELYGSPETKDIDYEKLIDLYKKAAETFNKEGNQSLEAQSLLYAAQIATKVKKLDVAKEFYEKILNYYIKSQIWAQAARVSTILGKYPEAINYYKKEVEENKNVFYQPYLYITVGEYHVISKEHAKAIENFKLALKAIEQLLKTETVNWKRDELSYLQNWTAARILFQEGIKYSEIDNHTKAQEQYEKAAEKFESGIVEGIIAEKRSLLKAFINLCNGLHAFEEMQKLEEKGDLDSAKNQRKLFNFNLNHANVNFIKAGQINIAILINSILEAVEENEFSKAKTQAATIFSSFQPVSTQKLSKLGLANTYLTCSIKNVKPLQLELNETCTVSIQVKIDEKYFSETADNWLPLFVTCKDSLFSPIQMPVTLTANLPQFEYTFMPKFVESGETTIKIQVADINQDISLKSLNTDTIKVLKKYIPLQIILTIENDEEAIFSSCDISGAITQKIKPVKLKITTSELLKSAGLPEEIVSRYDKANEEFLPLGKKLFNDLIPNAMKKELIKAIDYAKSQNIPVNIMINASRALMSVPFELLFLEQPQNRGFLSTMFPFFRYPVEKQITPIEKLTSKIARVLLIASNPLDGDADLPGVDPETKNIQDTLNKIGIQTKMISSSESHLQNVLEELMINEYDAIHFSGHGFFDSKNPMESGLVLGVKGRPPEYLTARDIKEILQETKLKLIFLNCCYSAAQPKQILLHEDVLGLADAFIQVGISALIGMQWPITDMGAVILSKNFYEEVFRRNVDYQTALKVAKLQLIKESQNDPSWACPMLIKHPSL